VSAVRVSLHPRPTQLRQPLLTSLQDGSNYRAARFGIRRPQREPEPHANSPSLRELKMLARVRRFVQDQSGASAVEYGLVAAGILVAIIAVMQGLGAKLNAALGALN